MSVYNVYVTQGDKAFYLCFHLLKADKCIFLKVARTHIINSIIIISHSFLYKVGKKD